MVWGLNLMLTRQAVDGILWHVSGDPNFSDVAASPYEQLKVRLDTYDLHSLPTEKYDRRLLPEYGGDI